MITARTFIRIVESNMNYTETIDKLRRLARGEDCCDDELFALLSSQGCHYLISKSKSYASKQTVTLAFNSIMQKKRYQVCKNVTDMLEAESIPYAHIKGAALSQRIYGNLAYRSSGDIDLLVPTEYSDQAKSALERVGFIQGKLADGKIIPYTRKELIYQKSFSHQLAAFMKATGDKFCPFVNIDVNLDIIWGESKLKIDMTEFVSHTEPIELYGVKLYRLQPVWEFISLCTHHYKDMNSIYLLCDRGLSLAEYCDIYFYLVNASPDAGELADVAKRYQLSEYIYYCIYYANKLFDDERLIEYLDKLYSERARELLNSYGLDDSERCEWEIPFYDRLFDVRFRDRFALTLSDEQMRKVRINREFM